VPLDRAVASSCAVPGLYPPVTIGGRRYMDGGVGSATNANLAAGASAVIVLDVLGHLTPREPLAAELASVGTDRAVVITPDEAGVAAIGTNLLDPATAPAALKAGLAQAASCAGPARAIWPGQAT
jgi:NTE family protein